MDDIWSSLLETARENQSLALLMAFVIAGCESIAGISLFIPSTIIFLSLSALLGAAGQNLILLWLAVSLGAAAGDWVSYGLGFHFKERVVSVWPLSRYPHLLQRGRLFFARWGWQSILVCRFLGPVRAMIMVAAGMMRMPRLLFLAASLTSAALWAAVVLMPAYMGGRWLSG